MLEKKYIKLKLTGKTKDEILLELVEVLNEGGALEDKDEFLKVVKQREATSSTGLEEGIAIPHGKTRAVKKPAVAFGRSEGVDFDSLDGEPSKLFFMIAAPENATDSHIETLSKLTNKLLDDELRERLEIAKTEDEVLAILSEEKKVEEKAVDKKAGFVIAVTACPVGIAHTYMAADSLVNKGKELGIEIKVETNGSVGVKNELSAEDIKRATGVIVAADKTIDMDRFAGKRVIQVPVKQAIRVPKELIEKTLNGEGEVYVASSNSNKDNKGDKKEKTGIYKHLMNGVSHMLPLVVCGGVLIALSIALSGIKAGSGADVTNPFFKSMLDLGAAAFGLMIPILAGYIAMSIADRPGLAPGLVGGALANSVGAGFLGGMVAGFAAGYIAKWVKSWNVPEGLKPIMPIFVIPLVSTSLVGVIMYFIGAPISGFMNMLTDVLKGMESGSIFLALILGCMISFDMGGPINKVAFLFGSAMITQGVPTVMGPIAVAICIPPISMGIATMMAPKNYESGEREAGKAAFAMGLIGITEGAIPFAAADPFRVIPSIMVGSGVGAVIAAIGKVADHAPHGGPIVLPVVENKLMFIVAIVVGSLVSAIMVNILKKIKK
ncbi:fructose-specific PTS transporter subunit EIIC [Cetobacterium sp. ZWU0022]|uniref:PTS fructose transporter subunit IIABC n=1 Tax=Cetobacterium sp. ZWU0022 TaxID=1340502 RepID=UPI000647EA28|nr:fructose-specific PTS transporter subunit EIIC [Cetobacterium sp. ZWU0022]